MEESVSILFGIFVSLLLVIANGFFVAVEFALVRSHPTKLKAPEMKTKMGSGSALKLIDALDLSLSATQVGITIASLILGWWGELTFNRLIIDLFDAFSIPVSPVVSHAVATAFAIVILTFLHVVLGELVCKSVAIRYPETCLRVLAPMMLLFTIVCRPIIGFLNASANLFLWLVGIRTPAESERVHSLAELAMLVSHSTERGVIDKTEEEMLQGVFQFSETVAREVMTPRTDLITIPVDATFDDVLQIAVTSGLSRFPVVGETVDDVLGLLLLRDMLPYFAMKSGVGSRDFSLRRVMREPFFVPGTKPIDDLLNEFKRRKVHIAVVLDEHGGVDGVVTLEDVIEEIVGDIFDESDEFQRAITRQENGDHLVEGGVLVADINERLGFEIPEGDYDTVAGFIYAVLGRLPRVGDTVLLYPNGQFAIEGQVETRQSLSQVGRDSGTDDEGTNWSEEPGEELRPVANIVVERVQGRRIETVRLQRLVEPEIVESDHEPLSSQAKG
ncbi:MAG: HlyC/CorC family transporter [Deltaproteobacteria bacterium]|nr:HlyC/CorC family transporter [Deltaproteobacteria bacterium]